MFVELCRLPSRYTPPAGELNYRVTSLVPGMSHFSLIRVFFSSRFTIFLLYRQPVLLAFLFSLEYDLYVVAGFPGWHAM